MSDSFCPACGTAFEGAAGGCVVCGQTLPLGRVAQPLALDELLEGRYRLLRPLGVGGFSTVYEAQDTRWRKRLIFHKRCETWRICVGQPLRGAGSGPKGMRTLGHSPHG